MKFQIYVKSSVSASKDEAETDDFDTSAEQGKKLGKVYNKNLIQIRKLYIITLYGNFLYALRNEKENKPDICDRNEFKKVINEKLIEQLDEKNINLCLICKKLIITATKLIRSYQIIITF